MHSHPQSTQPFSAHDCVKKTLDGGVFLLANGAQTQQIHSISDEVLKLAMKSANEMVSALFGLDHRAMRRINAVLDMGAGPNLIRSDALPSGQIGSYPSA